MPLSGRMKPLTEHVVTTSDAGWQYFLHRTPPSYTDREEQVLLFGPVGATNTLLTSSPGVRVLSEIPQAIAWRSMLFVPSFASVHLDPPPLRRPTLQRSSPPSSQRGNLNTEAQHSTRWVEMRTQ